MDNLLKAVVDAIAESDNETAGQILTRLRVAHRHGQDNGQTAAGNPTRLTSPVDIFQAGDVGMGIDIIRPVGGTPTGNEGSYLVATFIDAQNVTLSKLGTGAPAFTTQKPVRWRFTTLRVETTLGFPSNDRLLQLWVGEEPGPTNYAELVDTPAAQEFRGLGAHRFEPRATIRVASPTVLSTLGAFFVSGDVGKAVWILPHLPSSTGNQGGRRIISVAGDGKSVTLAGTAFVADEDNAHFVIKDYLTPAGYLAGRRDRNTRERFALNELSEVVDGSGSFSSLDRVRRALLTDYGAGEELDRIGRNLGVRRLLGMDDETYRCILQTMPYLPKGTVYGIELLLECLFPQGGASIYEDLVNFPNLVFILTPTTLGNSVDFEGKAFLAPTGKDVTPPIDPTKPGGAALGRERRERQTSGSTTTITVAHTPVLVYDVLQEDFLDTQQMNALPSTLGWTFVIEADTAPTEAQIFTIISLGGVSWLAHVMQTAPSNDGGRYKRTIRSESLPGSQIEFTSWFKFSGSSFGSFPWHMHLNDLAGTGTQYGLFIGATQVKIAPDFVSAGSGAVNHGMVAGSFYHLRLVRRTVGRRHLVSCYVNGRPLLVDIDVGAFTAATATEASFGYFYNVTGTQNWTAEWERLVVRSSTPRNHWNLARQDGAFNGTTANLTSAAALFISGDVGRRIRIRDRGVAGIAADVNLGEWKVKTFNSTSSVELEGIVSGPIATVSSASGSNFVDLLDPWFVPQDLNKQIEISTSVLGNNGSRKVLEYINPKRVRVSGAAFVAELGLAYRFNPFDGTTAGRFAAATSVHWELVATGTNTGTALTLREVLPTSSFPTEVGYTSVKSAQLLRNEFVRNDGSLGAEPNIYFPFYLFDLDRASRELIDDVTVAGVLPAYERVF